MTLADVTQDVAYGMNNPAPVAMQNKRTNPHIQDLADLTMPLVSDLEFCRPHLHGEHAMFWRRAFTRATCAYIEGTLSVLRRFALRFAENQVPRDPGKVSVLRRESYSADDDGSVKTRNVRLPRLQYLAAIFRNYAESLGSKYELDRTEPGWRSLKTAFQVRDRITHPDSAVELEINDEEIRAVEEAFCFFWNSLAFLWDGMTAGFRQI